MILFLCIGYIFLILSLIYSKIMNAFLLNASFFFYIIIILIILVFAFSTLAQLIDIKKLFNLQKIRTINIYEYYYKYFQLNSIINIIMASFSLAKGKLNSKRKEMISIIFPCVFIFAGNAIFRITPYIFLFISNIFLGVIENDFEKYNKDTH